MKYGWQIAIVLASAREETLKGLVNHIDETRTHIC